MKISGDHDQEKNCCDWGRSEWAHVYQVLPGRRLGACLLWRDWWHRRAVEVSGKSPGSLILGTLAVTRCIRYFTSCQEVWRASQWLNLPDFNLLTSSQQPSPQVLCMFLFPYTGSKMGRRYHSFFPLLMSVKMAQRSFSFTDLLWFTMRLHLDKSIVNWKYPVTNVFNTPNLPNTIAEPSLP